MGLPINQGGSRGRSGADLGQWGGWDSTGTNGGFRGSNPGGDPRASMGGNQLDNGIRSNLAPPGVIADLNFIKGPGLSPGDQSFIDTFNKTPQVDPATGGPPVTKSPFAPTSAQTAANPAAFAGTSFDPVRSLARENQGTPGGATSMGMQGAGIGSQGAGYYGSNGPLDRSRFTPQGGAGQAWYNQVFGKSNPNNISYLGFMDQLGRQALAFGGQPDWVNGDSIGQQIAYLNSEQGQNWLNRLTKDPNAPDNLQTGGPDPGPEPGATPPPDPPPVPPASPAGGGGQTPKIDPQTPQGASQLVNAMLQGGFQHRDIPINLRLMALGVAGQNPLVGSMKGGGSLNPLMALLGL